ncbi:MAG TPA: hypothetical protein VNW15_10125 [Rhizomicrobium sp.]|nr:hypothetical protein [Rhizomicrobium sp.]
MENAVAHAGRVTATKGALMIFRAIFWIGLVSLLMPHEPDTGLGRPAAVISLPAMLKSWGDSGLARADGLGPIGAMASGRRQANYKERSLADVKNEIDASIRARAAYAL